MTRYCDVDFEWERLALNADDFEKFNLIPLETKKLDKCRQKFIDEHGEQCAELDALPPNELRRRIRDVIESHIPKCRWKRLQKIEQEEKETFNRAMAVFKNDEKQ